jgi:hypothetical protein
MELKTGDSAIYTARHGQQMTITDVTIASAGKLWLTVKSGRSTLRFNATRSKRGSHYGDYGATLWPSRAAYRLDCRRRIVDRLARRAMDAGLTHAQSEAVAAALGLVVTEEDIDKEVE